MRKNGFSLIEVLSVIVILAVISVIAYPNIINIIGNARISAYNSAKGNIVESAKMKYMASVNSAKVTEYSVKDLIDDGYLKEDTKNPITNKDYEDTKVIITNNGNNITTEYVSGVTLFDRVKKKTKDDGLYIENGIYVYKGKNAQNYISFNGEIYRILKIDGYQNAYLLKDELNVNVSKSDIEEYVNSYYNDNYSEIVKNNIVSLGILDYNDYKTSYLNNDTYIINNSNIWVNDNEYKSLSYITNDIDNNAHANLRLVLKLKNTVTIISGDGSQLNPFVVID